MTGFLAKLFGREEGRDAARPLYAAIVAEARAADWYMQGGVEDSVSGRYEALALVFTAVAIRLEALGGEAETVSVLLTECFVEDIEGQLRQDGVVNIPKRPTDTTRANPGGLTNRQLEVARLLARGLTNSEIATEVYISTKTAEHHVSAVLTKLGLPNRRAVVQAAVELGLA